MMAIDTSPEPLYGDAAAPEVMIIGAGHAGLAMSYCLSQQRVPHLVLERGSIGERWRGQSWDSLRLLTPNSFTRLPGREYAGDSPQGFMPVNEWLGFLESYAASFNAPVLRETPVDLVTRTPEGLLVKAGGAAYTVRAIVIATGHCSEPHIPELAQYIPAGILQLCPAAYRNPGQLPGGGVLIAGCGASGVQIADELVRSGRKVIIAAGRHRRLPRMYRERDILWWADRIGVFAQRTDAADLMNIPAPQLIGTDEKRSLDLGILQELGVTLAGRIGAVNGSKIFFHNDLEKNLSAADAEMHSLLAKIDHYALLHGIGGQQQMPPPIRPLTQLSEIDLYKEGIRTVVWATGYRRSYPWLRLGVLDQYGELRHTGGITAEPGVYVLGLRRQIRYNSNFIGGAGDDALELSAHLVNFLASHETIR